MIEHTICISSLDIHVHVHRQVCRGVPAMLLCPLLFDQVMNELVVDRGPHPYLCNLELYCNGRFMTSVQGDGKFVWSAATELLCSTSPSYLLSLFPSSIHVSSLPLTLSFTHSLTHWLMYILIHPFIHSLIHHLHTHSLPHSRIYMYTLTHSITNLCTYSFTHLLTH